LKFLVTGLHELKFTETEAEVVSGRPFERELLALEGEDEVEVFPRALGAAVAF
jgi:hypothetical protein